MTHMLDDDAKTYTAIINSEQQYSLWPADRDPPRGWTRSGPVANRDEIMNYIESAWQDMRPASLRQAMADRASSADPASHQA